LVARHCVGNVAVSQAGIWHGVVFVQEKVLRIYFLILKRFARECL
jgi:hypothetical protein